MHIAQDKDELKDRVKQLEKSLREKDELKARLNKLQNSLREKDETMVNKQCFGKLDNVKFQRINFKTLVFLYCYSFVASCNSNASRR
jgi:cell division protein FtsB